MAQKRFAWFNRDPAFYKKLALIALPLAGQSVISFGVGLSDNLMVSHLGESSIGGIFVANQIQGILHMLLMGLAAALVILAAQYYGKGDIRSVKIIISFSLYIATGVGLALLLVMTFFGRPVLGLLSTADSVVSEGITYMAWLRWSFIFFALTNVLIAAMRCAGMVNIGIVSAVTVFITNLVFNYVFIFGKLGAPEMGVAGAALATLISRVIEFAVVAFYVLRRDTKIRYRLKDLTLRNKALSLDYIRYGLPVIFGDIFWGLGNTAKAAIIGRLGESVIAANSLVGNLSQLFFIFIYGIASAGSLTVGQAIGKNEYDTAKNYTKTLQIVYPAVGLVSATIMFSARGAVLSLPAFRALEPQTMRYCMEFLTILCATMVGTSYQMATLQIVRAGGATHFVFVNDLIFVWLVMIPMALVALLVFDAPPWVIFFSIHCDQILKCGVAVVKVNRYRWMKNLTR
ncbi:MAG: MATE family efflux transporter [Oscillospiraceae bacterium]|nr:MATE family efflux transporter [Oscillospiraceae bacterium]